MSNNKIVGETLNTYGFIGAIQSGKTNFIQCELEGVSEVDTFTCENIEFLGCSFEGDTINGMRFNNCKFQNSHFDKESPYIDVWFSACEFQNCDFEDTRFYHCKLNNSKFADCDFDSAVFTAIDLINTEYRNCNLQHSEFSSVLSDNVTFDGCDMGHAVIVHNNDSNWERVSLKNAFPVKSGNYPYINMASHVQISAWLIALAQSDGLEEYVKHGEHIYAMRDESWCWADAWKEFDDEYKRWAIGHLMHMLEDGEILPIKSARVLARELSGATDDE
jgi:uncharacterized protein YjbI with pentapeptide repeats